MFQPNWAESGFSRFVDQMTPCELEFFGRSRHPSAVRARCLFILLYNWPFPSAPWQMLNPLLEECKALATKAP